MIPQTPCPKCGYCPTCGRANFPSRGDEISSTYCENGSDAYTPIVTYCTNSAVNSTPQTFPATTMTQVETDSEVLES